MSDQTDEKPEVSPAIVVGLVRIIDILIVGLSALGSVAVHAMETRNDLAPYWIAILIVSGVSLNAFTFAGIYRFERLRIGFAQMRKSLGIWTVAFLAFILVAFVFKISDQISRGWIAAWYLSGGTLLVAHRAGITLLLRHWMRGGRLTRKVAVIGAGELGQRFINHVRTDRSLGVTVLGLFDDRHTRVPSEIAGMAITGGLASLVAFCRNKPVQTVVIALPLAAETRILELIALISPLPVDIKLLPDLAGFQLLNKPVSYLAEIPVLSAYERPMKDWGAVAKTAEDLILASILVVLTAPLMLLIAIVIKAETRGPVLFRQKRYGFNHQLIEVFKFRSMYHDRADANASILVTRNDDRVTKVGRFLRRSSLDELPQMYNVLLGTMSLVGPRPHAVNAKAANKLYDEAVANYASRHRVKPGITGWAQVNGWRGETDTIIKIEARVEHDLYYIDQWSLFFDMYILFLTIFRGFMGKNAY